MNQPRPKASAATAVVTPPAHPDPPGPVLLAVRLMYAGAALTAVGALVDVIAVVAGGTAALRATHKHATLAQLHATQGALITSVLFSGLIEAGLWLFMARANRAGLKWARLIAGALFGISTVLLATSILGGSALTLVAFTALTWLVGLGATIFLWQKESSSYFA